MADNLNTVPADEAAHSDYSAEQNDIGFPDLASISPMFAKLQAGANGTSSTQENSVPAPDDATDDDDVPPVAGDGNANEDAEVDNAEEAKADADEQGSTQEAAGFSEDEVDWTFKVPVKIDGKEQFLTLEQLRKGYATDQHLSAKGRELGEARKALETERDQKLQEIVALGNQFNTKLEGEMGHWQKEYHTLKTAMDKAVEEGDGYEAKELAVKVKEAQTKYWEAKTERDTSLEAVSKHLAEAQAAEQQKRGQYFYENVKTVFPEFLNADDTYNQELAGKIRSFAISEGIPEELLGAIYEPVVVKVLNDYRVLKERSNTGAAKRTAAPVAKAIPSKKPLTGAAAQSKAQKDVRDRVASGNFSKNDELAFLKSISKRQF